MYGFGLLEFTETYFIAHLHGSVFVTVTRALENNVCSAFRSSEVRGFMHDGQLKVVNRSLF